MAFSHRIATLAAVVAIPLGITATSYALTDRPAPPEVPGRVELDSGSPTGSPHPSGGPEPTGSGTAEPGGSPTASPGDVVVPQPPATEGSDSDDDVDDSTDDSDDN